MANLLYLVHRLPFPPNKGDKVRSYHLLKHLSERHRVFLGTFVDDPADAACVEVVRQFCADLCAPRLNPRLAKVRSLAGLVTREALSVRYYDDAGLGAWVRRTLADQKIDVIVIFSSVMAQYVAREPSARGLPVVVDFVDVDSAKWTQYAAAHRWPWSWLYRREGLCLLAYERALASRSRRSFFVTESELALFQGMAPECASKLEAMSNGVDSDYFAPDLHRASPFAGVSPQIAPEVIVFTGAMDYWPNIDAVIWFVNDMLPALRRTRPQLCFYIVGRNPSPSVLALAGEAVRVTGTVADVRPYLQHATAVVAPLRVARGIQNKILEAMAMARPVVASRACAEAIDADGGVELSSAVDAPDFVRALEALLQSPARAKAMGLAGRERVIKRYSWAAHLSHIDHYLEAAPAAMSRP